jgi:hypothetical protein
MGSRGQRLPRRFHGEGGGLRAEVRAGHPSTTLARPSSGYGRTAEQRRSSPGRLIRPNAAPEWQAVSLWWSRSARGGLVHSRDLFGMRRPVAGADDKLPYHKGTDRNEQMPSPRQGLPRPELSSLQHEGVISRVLDDGYAYVDETGPTRKRYIVSFSRSIPNYRGESARELRLSRGTVVRFSRVGNEIQRIAVGPDFEEFLDRR